MDFVMATVKQENNSQGAECSSWLQVDSDQQEAVFGPTQIVIKEEVHDSHMTGGGSTEESISVQSKERSTPISIKSEHDISAETVEQIKEENENSSSSIADDMVKCLDCEKSYSSVSALNRHRRDKHGEIGKYSVSKILCPIEECILQFHRYSKLREHLKVFHDISTSTEEFVFDSDKEFDIWLHSIQNELTCQYLIRTSFVQGNGCKRIKLYCSRSNAYQFRPERKGDVKKRTRKFMGSKKIGRACPSTIEVVKKDAGNSVQINVKFWKDHFGHNDELQHTTIPKIDRDEIARKLKSGVTFERILKDIRNPVDPNFSWSKRTRLIERIDLHNIFRQYCEQSIISSTTSQTPMREPQEDQNQSNFQANSENSEVESLFTMVESKEHVPAREKMNTWLKIVNYISQNAPDNKVEEKIDIVVKDLMNIADNLNGEANSKNVKEKKKK